MPSLSPERLAEYKADLREAGFHFIADNLTETASAEEDEFPTKDEWLYFRKSDGEEVILQMYPAHACLDFRHPDARDGSFGRQYISEKAEFDLKKYLTEKLPRERSKPYEKLQPAKENFDYEYRTEPNLAHHVSRLLCSNFKIDNVDKDQISDGPPTYFSVEIPRVTFTSPDGAKQQ